MVLQEFYMSLHECWLRDPGFSIDFIEFCNISKFLQMFLSSKVFHDLGNTVVLIDFKDVHSCFFDSHVFPKIF